MNDVRESILAIVKTIDRALALERNASDFYRRASGRTVSDTGRMMFEWLARFEQSHQARLMKKREELLGHSSITEEIPIDLECSLSEADSSQEISPDASDIDVLKMAVKGERRAIAYYEKKITHSQDESVKAMFRSMVREEEKHIQILTDQINHLNINRMWADFEDLNEKLKGID